MTADLPSQTLPINLMSHHQTAAAASDVPIWSFILEAKKTQRVNYRNSPQRQGLGTKMLGERIARLAHGRAEALDR